MKKNIILQLLAIAVSAEGFAAVLEPSDAERSAVFQAVRHYNRQSDSNSLNLIESFYKKHPDYGYHGILNLKNDNASHTMFYRLFYEVPNRANCRKFLIHKLAFGPESDALLKLFIETALNKEEDEATRIAAMNDLHDTKWPRAQQSLAEIFLKIGDESYRNHMLEVAVNAKNPELGELFLGYYRHFHPKQDSRYARHYARVQELKVKMAENARHPKPDPLALVRAEAEWWDKFIRKERKVTLEEAKQSLANFAKTPVLERLELAWAIQHSLVPDAELLRRLERLIPDEPSSLVKASLIETIATYQPNIQAKLQYYRRVAGKETNPDLLLHLNSQIKLIEDGKVKR